ncbi:MAG: HAMP domain-containing histidine kinase [Anaerolineae bacterium]|nr:HAMP domain-containing histidine kinase [Anaerolineae bacterium]
MGQAPIDPNLAEAVQGIEDLGQTTGSFFSRLYRGLNSRKELREAQELLQQATQQTRQAESRNRLLRQMIEQRNVDVERLQAILEQISEGIIMQDMQGRMVMMNQAALDLLGSQRNFWMSDLGHRFRESLALQASGGELAPVTEATRTAIGNRVVSAQVAAIADHQGDALGTLMILRDVTEDELAERFKNTFAAHISHELITPLAPMRVASEMLLNAPADQAPNRRMLEMVGRNIDILDRMVTEMLDMSALTSSNFRIIPEPVALQTIIWDVVESFSEDMSDRELHYRLILPDDEVFVPGDLKYLRWAISNLVRNAVQYNERHGLIMVMMRPHPDDPQHLELQVRDTGVGISDDDLPYIFTLFYRGEARTSDGKKLDPRGLGQGLYVAQRVAKVHGGSLTVETKPGHGSTFTMILPTNGLQRRMPPGLPG